MKFTGEKFDRLIKVMQKGQVDAIVIGPSGDMQYLIGFNPGGCERFQALFILADGRGFYVTNILYHEDMREALGEKTLFYLWKDSEDFITCLKRAFSDFQLYGKTLAISNSIRAVDLIEMDSQLSFDFVNGNEMLENYRAVKTWENIADMKRAAKLADEVMGELTRYIKPGMSEADIQNKISELFAAKGADETIFAIVASGSNNSRPHYNKNDRIITDKDVIVLDFGCKINGYCSDTSRTFFVGEIVDEYKRIYETVRKAYHAATDFAREGVTAGEVDQKARAVIENAGYGENFLSRTGHGIGYDVHEAPYIKGNNDQAVEKGMAFSIEPGIYIAGKVGIRIEDIVIINEEGQSEALNQFTKEIVVL